MACTGGASLTWLWCCDDTVAVRIDNNIPASEVRSWATPDEADIWMDANRNRTQGVFHIDAKFTMDGGGNRVISAVKYALVLPCSSTRRRVPRANLAVVLFGVV